MFTAHQILRLLLPGRPSSWPPEILPLASKARAPKPKESTSARPSKVPEPPIPPRRRVPEPAIPPRQPVPEPPTPPRRPKASLALSPPRPSRLQAPEIEVLKAPKLPDFLPSRCEQGIQVVPHPHYTIKTQVCQKVLLTNLPVGVQERHVLRQLEEHGVEHPFLLQVCQETSTCVLWYPQEAKLALAIVKESLSQDLFQMCALTIC